jgi:hypothetical protein
VSGQAFVHAGGPTEDALYDYLAGRLHPDAEPWIAEHVRGCRRCGEVVARVEAAKQALQPPAIDPFARQRTLNAVRKKLEKPQRRFVPAWALATAAAAACAIFFVMHKPAVAPTVAKKLAPAPQLPWTVLARAGAADVQVGDNHSTAEANAGLPTGGVLAAQPGSKVIARWGGARVVVDGGAQGAKLKLASSRSDERALELAQGRVVLDVDPLAPGQTLSIVTDDARVTVHGTLFLVERTAGGTAVAVERGVVRVARAGREVVQLTAGQRLLPGAATAQPLDDDSKKALGTIGEVPSGESLSESLDVFADVPGAQVAIDGLVRGIAPLSLVVAPGPHRIRVSARGRLPVEERVDSQKGAPTVFHAELGEPPRLDEPAPAPSKKPTEKGAPEPKLSGDPLTDARSDVLAGRYDAAIKRLETLRKHPPSETQALRATLLEAQADRLSLRPERAVPLLEHVARSNSHEAEQAQVMLAQTLGRDLGDPRRAADSWADAQRRWPNGLFKEEIAFRLGESLVAAGETREGVAALERYLSSFPKAAHVDDAHLLVAGARRDRLADCSGALPHLHAVAAGDGPRAEAAMIGEARCLKQVGRLAESQKIYAKYLSDRPRGRFADEARVEAGGRAAR